MDVVCVQETRWRGSGCRLIGAIGRRYKLFWMGSKAKSDGVGIFVAEKWVDSVVTVERHSEDGTEDGLFTKCFHGICSSLM